jgi:hypothetical protein
VIKKKKIYEINDKNLIDEKLNKNDETEEEESIGF